MFLILMPKQISDMQGVYEYAYAMLCWGLRNINTFLHEAFVVMSLEYFILDHVLSFREHAMIITTEQIRVNLLRK